MATPTAPAPRIQPMNPDQYQPVAQAMLAYFDREDVMIPGHMAEQIVSGKSLLRALLGGQLVLGQQAPAPAPAEKPDTENKTDEKAA